MIEFNLGLWTLLIQVYLNQYASSSPGVSGRYQHDSNELAMMHPCSYTDSYSKLV